MPADHIRPRRVVVLADRDLAAVVAADLRRITEAAAESHVLIVVPAAAVAGERWIVDLAARRVKAEERLEAWSALLAPHARSVEREVGDERARCALADARRAFQPDAVIAPEPDPAPTAHRLSLVARLLDRSAAPPARRLPTAA